MTSIFCCKLRSFLSFFLLSHVSPWHNTNIARDLLKPPAYATARSDTRVKNLCMTASLEAADLDGSGSFIQIESFIRGYHAYKDIWNPVIGEELPLNREPVNTTDEYAAAAVKDSCVVGHVLRLLLQVIFHFLARSYTNLLYLPMALATNSLLCMSTFYDFLSLLCLPCLLKLVWLPSGLVCYVAT